MKILPLRGNVSCLLPFLQIQICGNLQKPQQNLQPWTMDHSGKRHTPCQPSDNARDTLKLCLGLVCWMGIDKLNVSANGLVSFSRLLEGMNKSFHQLILIYQIQFLITVECVEYLWLLHSILFLVVAYLLHPVFLKIERIRL